MFLDEGKQEYNAKLNDSIEEEEDLMDKYLKYMLMSHIIGGTAAEEYSGTSSVSVGQARPWPTMTPMV